MNEHVIVFNTMMVDQFWDVCMISRDNNKNIVHDLCFVIASFSHYKDALNLKAQLDATITKGNENE